MGGRRLYVCIVKKDRLWKMEESWRSGRNKGLGVWMKGCLWKNV